MSHLRFFFCCFALLAASLLVRAGECGGWRAQPANHHTHQREAPQALTYQEAEILSCLKKVRSDS